MKKVSLLEHIMVIWSHQITPVRSGKNIILYIYIYTYVCVKTKINCNMPWNLPPSTPLWFATACPKSVSILSCLFTGWYGCSIGDDVFPWAPNLTTLRSFASPKAVWTYMSVFIGKNVDKPLDLGVCYFQTKSASEVDLEILSWNHQQVHWRVRYA